MLKVEINVLNTSIIEASIESIQKYSGLKKIGEQKNQSREIFWRVGKILEVEQNVVDAIEPHFH